MSAELSLMDLPTEVLLNIFSQIDDKGKEFESIATNLRLVNRRFNDIVSDRKNSLRLDSVRMKVNEITIGQIGSSYAIRVLAYGKEIIHAFPDSPSLNLRRRKGGSIHDKWIKLMENHKDMSSAPTEEFFEMVSTVIAKYDPEFLHFANLHLTRPFVSSLIVILKRHSRNSTLDFEEMSSCNGGNTEFSRDLDDSIIGELASNFLGIRNVPNRFLTPKFFEKWTEGAGSSSLSLSDMPEDIDFSPISLRCFAHIDDFFNWKCSTTAEELIDAVEARMKRGLMRWNFVLTDKEWEIRRIFNRCGKILKYQVSERPEDRRFKFMKVFKFNGDLHEVHIAIKWNDALRVFIATVGTRKSI